jgi:hypothetical protein
MLHVTRAPERVTYQLYIGLCNNWLAAPLFCLHPILETRIRVAAEREKRKR